MIMTRHIRSAITAVRHPLLITPTISRYLHCECSASVRSFKHHTRVKPAIIRNGETSNHLARQFKVSEPNKVWVTDMTYIRTYEGLLQKVLPEQYRIVLSVGSAENSRTALRWLPRLG